MGRQCSRDAVGQKYFLAGPPRARDAINGQGARHELDLVAEQLTGDRAGEEQGVEEHALTERQGQRGDLAVLEERNRLAREVHDGVAQDVASLGYLVDGIADLATDDAQRDAVAGLRAEVTRVVAELRASVYDLRNEMRAGEGLGQGVSSFARKVGSRSDLTVHVSLDEGATRLRPEIEAELLRIAQEAMNNARKHSGGRNLWVTCTVRPPHAEIEVLDDGHGLQHARPDSHGMRIMRERAESIGATLDVESLGGAPHGTRLRVRLGSI